MTDGVPARSLSDDDLRRELTQLKTKQHEVEAGGTVAQKANHAHRTEQLETEFLRRFGSESENHSESENDSGS